MVQVVSIDDVPMMFGSVSFQSNEVSGAQNSVFLLLLRRRRGVNPERRKLEREGETQFRGQV